MFIDNKFKSDWFNLVKQAERKDRNTLHLTANENTLSNTIRGLLSTVLSTRYHLGTFDDKSNIMFKQCYNNKGLMLKNIPEIFELEKTAREICNKMLFSKYTDFRLLSGLHAVFGILSVLTKPNDTIYIFAPNSFGHHSTTNIIHNLGRKHTYIPFCRDNMNINLEEFKILIKKQKPKLIFFDYGTPLYPIPIKEIRQIVGKDVLMVYDASHVLGLIFGQQFQQPLLDGCNILVANTHKSFPGSQKSLVAFNDESFGRKVMDAMDESIISSQHTHHSIALYASIIEMSYHGESYAKQIISNNIAFINSLKAHEFSILGNQIDTPKIHMQGITGNFNCYEACKQLHNVNISTNAKKMFGISAIRTGLQEVTRYGMKKNEMNYIAKLISDTIYKRQSPGKIRNKITDLRNEFPNIKYSFDINSK